MLLPLAIRTIADESDREFMKAVYMKYRVNMFRMARALTASKQDAEDVVSDACISLIQNISRLRRLDCNVLEGYVISTVKNAAYLLHRRKKARNETSGDEALLFVADETTEPDSAVLQECTIQELMRAIGQLPEGDQAVLRMKYFEKLPDRAIAGALGIQEASVRSRLTRARRRLFVLLGGTLYES